MLNTLDLKCFLTLARTLNFTRTAQALFLSQQAVSQRISRMEQDIGFPLFIRSRSFVKLTRAGERCFAFLAPLEEEGRKLFEECRQAFCQQCKTLRVGYQNMLNWGAILSHAQDAFQKEFPEIETVGELFDSVVLVEHLKAGTVDMIVIYDRFAPKMDGLEKLELFDVYRGDQVGKDQKSVSYSLVLRKADGTLTDQDCDNAVAKSLKKLEEIGVSLRQ